MPVNTRIQFRRGTAAVGANQWTSQVLYAGEVGYETDTGRFKIGDGSTAWSTLKYAAVVPTGFVGSSGVYVATSTNGETVTLSISGITSSQVTNFNSSVSGLLPVKSLVGGTNIAVTPSGDGAFIISTNGLDTNAVKDVVGATITGVSGISFNYNSTSKIGTISLSDPSIQSTDITDFNSSVSGLLGVKSLVQGSGIGIVNNSGVQTIRVTGIPSSLITDLGNIATTQVIGRTGIALSYDVVSDTMFLDATGVSFTGHTHIWSNITDASVKATLSELAYLSGVSAGTASSSRALVLDANKSITAVNAITTTGNVTVGGNLIVQGTTTTVNSTTVEIGDNIIRVNTSGLNTGGMEVYTGSDAKSVVWNTSANRWEFTGGNVYTSGNFIGSLSGNAATVTNGVYTTDNGTVTSTMIADNTIVNADINSSAAIAYSKLNLSSSIVNADIANAAAIADSKLATISTAGKVSNSATTATNANTASAIVSRDASGNFSAGTITANLSGNASTVTNGVYTTDTGTVTNTMLAGSITYSKLNLSNSIVNADISSTAAIQYSKLNLSSSITNSDIASGAAIALSKLAYSGFTLGTTTINLSTSGTVLDGLTRISGVSASTPTVLHYCTIDGGTP